MQETNIVGLILVLLISVVLHEIAHGYVALYFGDKTAYYAGRLTLNPIKHLDWFSSILLPVALVLFKSPILFGAAKPVPVNLANISPGRFPRIAIALAGIVTNILIAAIFSIAIRICVFLNFGIEILPFLGLIVMVNISLAVFNLFPIPPLDGSKVLISVLPYRYQHIEHFLDSYGFVILIGVLLITNMLHIDLLATPVRALFRVFTGF